ncbi:MAG: hypothetical protein MI741_12270 [Rhodospirillales bacterium]|nr:hypothetical protein [Rhodospirillales bacterium]
MLFSAAKPAPPLMAVWPLSWFIGHVKKGEAQYVFAVRIEAKEKKTSGRKARRIALETLKELALFP